MEKPVIAQREPVAIDVEAGKKYFWCSCGMSAQQPFCDGSHKDTSFVPIQYEAEESKQVYFCCCKHSAMSPLCDGSHKNLEGT